MRFSQWSTHASSIKQALIEGEATCPGDPSVQILDAFGLTDNYPSVVLVDFCAGGAYTDWIVVMRMDGGMPVLAKFRDKKGRSVPNGFATGASVMHSVDVKSAPEKKAILDRFADNNSEGKLARCGARAYVWNPKTRTFDEDERVSRVASEDYCRSLQTAN